MTQKKSYFTGELGQRFGYRKLTIGLCSVVLGSFLLSVNNQQVKADTTDDNNQTAENSSAISDADQGKAQNASVVKETAPASDSLASATMVNSNNSSSANAQESTQQNSKVQETSVNSTQTDNATANHEAQTNNQVSVQNSVQPAVQNKSAQSTVPQNTQRSVRPQTKQVENTNVVNKQTTNDKLQNVADNSNNLQATQAANKSVEIVQTGNHSTTVTTNTLDLGKLTNSFIAYNVADNKIASLTDLSDDKNSDGFTTSGVVGYQTSTTHIQPEKSHIVHHNAVTHNVYHPEETHEQYHEASGHYENVQVQNGYDWHNTSGINENTGEWEEGVGSGWSNDDTGAYNNQATVYEPHYDTESVWVEDSPAWTETVVDSPAWNETVVDRAAYDEKIVDQKAYNNQNLAIDLIDVDPSVLETKSKGKQIGNAVFITGKVGESKKIDSGTITIPKGYKLANGETLTPTVTFKNSTDPYLIRLVHIIDTVPLKVGDPKDSNNPAGDKLENTDFTTDLSRTIHIDNEPNVGNHDITQHVVFNRVGYRDEATGLVKWDPYQLDKTKTTSQTASFDQYVPTKHDGYTMKINGEVKDNVEKIGDVTAAMSQSNIKDIDITYTANTQRVVINLVDTSDNNRIINSISKDGVTDETISLSDITVPTNYELAKGQSNIPSNYKFTADRNQVININLAHQVSGQPVSDGVPAIDLDRTFSRTITINNEPGKDAKQIIIQNVHFHHVGHWDLVTNKVVWDKWEVADGNTNFTGLTPQQHTGYSVYLDNGQTDVPTIDVIPDQNKYDIKDVSISYLANAQSVTYHFIDNDNNKQEVPNSAITENGVTDQDKLFSLVIPVGYDLAKGQNLPTHYKFLPENNVPINIQVVHHIDADPLKPNDPKNINDLSQGNLTDDDFDRDFQRTITIQNEPYAPNVSRVVTQEVHYSRIGHRDEATGGVRWENWYVNPSLTNSKDYKAQFDEFDPATYDGYTIRVNGDINTKKIGAQNVPVDIARNDIHNYIVSYSPDNQSLTFTWVDDDNNGAIVKTTTEHGVTDQHVKFTDTARPKGYDLAKNNQDAITEYTFKAKDNAPVTIHLTHHIDDNKVKEGDSDGQGGTVKKSDYDRTLTRQITFVNEPHSNYDPNRTITQSIHFTREGHMDYAISRIIWSDWKVEPTGTSSLDKSAKFDAMDIPQHDGYTTLVDGRQGFTEIPDQTGLNQNTDQKSIHNYKISYNANPQSITYTFVDDQNSQVKVNSVTESGVTDQHITFNNVTVPDGYALAEGQTLPTEYTFKAINNIANPIHLVHRVDTVTDLNQKDPDNGNKTLADLTDVKRTYTFVANVPDKYLANSDKQAVWNLHFHRDVKQDTITKKFIYGAWLLDGDPSYNEHTNADIDSPSMSRLLFDKDAPASDIYGYNVHVSQNSDSPLESSKLIANRDNTTMAVSAIGDLANDDDAQTKAHYVLNVSNPLDLPDSFTQTYNWTPDTRNTNIKYIDSVTGQQVNPDENSISGTVDTDVKYGLNYPNQYVLDHIIETKDGKDTNIGTKLSDISFVTEKDDKGNWSLDLPSYTVYLNHKVDQLKSGDYGTKDSDFNRHIERDITINTPDGRQSTQKQEYTFTRTGTYDEATQTVSFTPWSDNGIHKFASVDIPKIAGYESSGSVPEMVVIPDSSPVSSIEVTYKALGQNVTVNFVDSNGKVQKSMIVNGKTNDHINLNLDGNIPANWQMTDPKQTSAYTFTSDNEQTLNIPISHQIVAMPDETRTVTRTIKVTLPDGTVDQDHSITQSAKFTRNIKYDKVLGRNVYGNWTDPQTFNAIDLPDIDGYKTPNIPSVLITADSSSSTLDLAYTANNQNASIFYVDTDGNRIKTGTALGKTNETLPIHYKIPANWHAVGNPMQNYTFKAKDNTPITITITHDAKALADDVKTIERDVEIDKPNTDPQIIKQTVTFTRHAKQDLIDGHTIYGAWDHDGKYTFDKIKPDVVDGYAVNGSANEITVTPDANSKDLFTRITYVAGGQNNSYYFVDDDDNAKKIGDDYTFAGTTGGTVQLDIKPPIHYVLNDKADNPSSYTFKARGNTPLVIHVKHATADGTNDQGADTSRTFTRNITIVSPDGKVVNAQQIVNFKRNATKDLVTGQYTYGDWSNDSKGQFDAYPVNTIDGYTAVNKDTNNSITSIDPMTIDANTSSKTTDVNVIYSANKQNSYWMFVDDDATDPNSDTLKAIEQHHELKGVTGEDTKLNIVIPKNYHAVGYTYDTTDGLANTINGGNTSNVNLPNVYTFKAKNNAPLIIHLKHDTQSVSTENSDKGVDDSRTITRTIIISSPKGKDTTEKQSVTFTRDANKDLVTGKIIYGSWSNGGQQQMDEMDIPPIPGYSTDTKVPAITVTPDSKPSSISVHFTANDGQQTISYVDSKGNEIGRQVIKGKTDQEIKVDPNVPDGWKGKVPDKVTIPAEDKPIKVTIDHVHVIVTPDKPGTPGSVIPGTRAKVFPKGTGIADLTKDVSRTVTITTPDGKRQTTTQTVKFGRTADVDAITGDVTYTDWTPKGKDDFDPIAISTVPGYTPSQTEVPGVKNVPSDFKDKGGKNITITYNHNDGQQTIIYQDKNGKELGKQIVKGKVFDNVQLTPEFPKGYTNKNMPKTIKIPEVDKPITFDVDRIITKVHIDSDHPLNEGDIIPGTDIKAPKGLSKDDLNKDITRTITITTPDGQSNVTKQTVHAKRGATIDLNTKKITYDPWQTVGKDSFDPVGVPKIDGYKPNMDQVPGVEHVDPNKDYGNDLNIQVTYTKQAEKNTGDYSNGSGIVDTSASTDPTINGNGQLSGITWNGMNDKNTTIKFDNKSGKTDKHKKSSKLSSALLKNGKNGKNGKRNNQNSRRGYDKRGYGNNSYGDRYGNGYGYNNQYGTSYGNGYGYNSADSADSSSQSNNLSSGSSASSVATGQYGNKNLPQTGATQSFAVIALGLATVALSFGFAGTRCKRRN